jgi:hypothetical protein
MRTDAWTGAAGAFATAGTTDQADDEALVALRRTA